MLEPSQANERLLRYAPLQGVTVTRPAILKVISCPGGTEVIVSGNQRGYQLDKEQEHELY